MKWLDCILLPRSTRELARLNEIWEDFNDKKTSPEQTINLILEEKWKCQTSKVKLLLDFIYLTPPLTDNKER